MIKLKVAACLALCAFTSGNAQTAPVHVAPPYTPLIWDIDWSYLRDRSATKADDALHYLHLPGSNDGYVSIVAQVRERGEYQDHPGFGAQPPDNGYFLQRYLLSADAHPNDRFRMFIQLDSGLSEGRDGGPRPGIDRDVLDFNQGFVDIVPFRSGDNALTVRAGRQLISLGSTRLVAIGAGLNVEQPLDGFRLTLRAAGWTLDGLAVRPTTVKTEFFDNEPNSTQELWGVYVSHPLARRTHSNVDFYYLGFDHKIARYTQGIAHEQRHTLGARLWSHTPTWGYDFEYTGQIGTFGPDSIRAWGAGYNLSYTFVKRTLRPHLEIDGGFLSGDKNPTDNKLGTFNPLFPNGSYLSESILLGPYNLIITRPTFKMTPAKGVELNTNFELLWRQSTADGVYNIVGILTHPPNGSPARFIGSQIQQEISWQISRHWSGSFAFEHFFAGSFLKQSPPGRSLNFVAPQLTFSY
jgi:hypothetical protein